MAKKQSCCKSSNAAIYEDFQPKSETEEEEGAHILKLHLPDFSREQIRVIYVASSRTIRAQGERPIGKWIRFNESFPVPKNCNSENIQGEFGDGILKITIPKQCISPPLQKPEHSEVTGKQCISPPLQKPEHSEVTGTKNTSENKETSSMAVPPPKETGKVETSAIIKSEEKSEKQGITESKTEELGKSETEWAEGKKDYVFRGNWKVKNETSLMEVATTVMKTAMEKKEERSLVITTGVAVLVIAAVGAYAMFKIRSSAPSKG